MSDLCNEKWMRKQVIFIIIAGMYTVSVFAISIVFGILPIKDNDSVLLDSSN